MTHLFSSPTFRQSVWIPSVCSPSGSEKLRQNFELYFLVICLNTAIMWLNKTLYCTLPVKFNFRVYYYRPFVLFPTIIGLFVLLLRRVFFNLRSKSISCGSSTCMSFIFFTSLVWAVHFEPYLFQIQDTNQSLFLHSDLLDIELL